MEEVVLSDDLVIGLSEQINITLYPVGHFAVDLGFDSAAASVAEELAIQKQHPHGKYEYLLHKFVATHGRGAKAAQFLIDRFNVNRKMLLVNFLEKGASENYMYLSHNLGHPVMAKTVSHHFLCHQHTHFGDSLVVR